MKLQLSARAAAGIVRAGIVGAALGAGLVLAGPAAAVPIQINDDEGYARLARWESHLDDRIGERVRAGSMDSYRAWTVQKELDNVEMQVLKAYYDSDHGIDSPTYHRFAQQLRRIGSQIGDSGWREEDFSDDSDQGGYDNAPPPPDNYYREGQYESDCRSGNAAAGTIFGAIGGGLIGGAASHGNAGAVAGGVILGGLLGNALASNIDCDDQRYAFSTYNDGLNGDLDRDYRWDHDGRYGTFRATREYYDGGYLCRDFHTVSYRDGRRFERDGTACREADGYWHFR